MSKEYTESVRVNERRRERSLELAIQVASDPAVNITNVVGFICDTARRFEQYLKKEETNEQ